MSEPAIETAHPTERLEPGEAEATRKMISLLKRRLARAYQPPQRTLRDAHPKQHGLVRAEFIVEPNLSPDLRFGVFASVSRFPAWIRFSNMSDPPGTDFAKDSRGMAIKLMGVPGDKILPEERTAATQDFVLMSTDFFVTRTIEEFFQFVEAIDNGMWRFVFHLLRHPRLLVLFLRTRRICASVVEIPYGSTTPYLLGQQVVKYTLRPCGPITAAIPSSPGPDFLREELVQRLRKESVTFDFFVQRQVDDTRTPTEDPRKVWAEDVSPRIKLATIQIPIQEFDSASQREYGDNLAFSPWHSLPDHRPLGGINRARRAIYSEMSRFRRERNGVLADEPNGFVDLQT